MGTHYKVKLNETDIAFINKADRNFRKQSITDFAKEWTTLGLDFDRSANPLRETPQNTGKIINHPDENNTGFGVESL
jgi:hypothetical protein